MKASEWRSKATPEPNPELVIDLPLPSGFICKATRPSLETWIISGAAPLAFMDKVMQKHKSGAVRSPDEIEADIEDELADDPEKVERANRFMVDAVRRAVVYPRIVDKADPKNEGQIELKDLPDRDFAFIFRWVLEGCPGVPVKTERGQIEVSDVNNFPAQPKLRKVGEDVSKRRRTTKRKARIKR